jgi:hypothetical protein
LKTRVKIGLRFSSARTLKFHADEAEHTRLSGFSTTGAVLFTGGGESRAIPDQRRVYFRSFGPVLSIFV